MSDFPNPGVTPLLISTWSRYTCGYQNRIISNLTVPAQRTWVANLAVYIPFWLPFPYPLKRVFWANGGTVTTSNADVGVYSSDGARIYSTGSTALSGASVLQFGAAADALLNPGVYYLAYSCDNTTNRANGTVASLADGRIWGLLQQSSAFPLPATMTPVAWDATGFYVLAGITRTSTGF